MTVLQSIDNVVKWLSLNVCDKITFKVPDDDANDANYGVKYATPAAFPLYVPGKDRLPPSVPAPIPSVCVQLMEGEDNLPEKKRRLKIRLCLACWNPGEHGDEIFHPQKDLTTATGYSYYRENKAAEQSYARNMEGWKDSFNFIDLTLRELEITEYIEGLRLVKEDGVKFGLFTEDGNIYDYYPYWHSWITFTLEAGVVANNPKFYDNYL